MYTHRKLYVLAIGMLLMAGVLAACGDNTAPLTINNSSTTAAIPAATTAAPVATTAAPAGTTAAGSNQGAVSGGLAAIAGASAVAIPDTLKQAVAGYTSSVPGGGSFTAYKSAEKTDKIKATLSDNYKKDGWTDQSSQLAAVAPALEQQGIFILLFQKGTKITEVIGYPGTVASGFGVSVGPNETFYIVVTGG